MMLLLGALLGWLGDKLGWTDRTYNKPMIILPKERRGK
jgi:hypothetical protein